MPPLSKRIEDVSAALGRLSRREKFMVGGASFAFVVFVGTLLSMWVSSNLGSLEKRISSKTKSLEIIIGLREQYEEAKEEQRRSQERIKRDRNLQLMGTLENLAKQLGINTSEMQMNPRAAALNAEAGIEEKKVEVTIPHITIDRLVDFLEQVERKSDSIKVRTLHIRKNFKDPTHLDAEFSVSKFELQQQKDAAAAAVEPEDK